MTDPDAGGEATVDVLVVTRDTRELTASALRRLVDSDPGVRFRVQVQDNASSGGAADAVHRAVPEPDVFAGSTNLGFAAAVNQPGRRSRAVPAGPQRRRLSRAVPPRSARPRRKPSAVGRGRGAAVGPPRPRLYRGWLAAAAYRRLEAANVARLAGADKPSR